MQAAAARMDEHVGNSMMVFSNSTNDWHAAEVVEEKEEWVDVEFDLNGCLCRKRLQRHSAHLKAEDEVPRLMAQDIVQQAQVSQAQAADKIVEAPQVESPKRRRIVEVVPVLGQVVAWKWLSEWLFASGSPQLPPVP